MIRVITATHKPYWMPTDPLYLPLQVGRAGHLTFDIAGDDTGDHISGKNANYCELTGLYWAWKNLDVSYLGLDHYRRHFTLQRFSKRKQDVLSEADAREILKTTDVILPKKRHYIIETTYSQYAHAHHAVDLDVTRVILTEKYPEYVNAFDRVMKQRAGHRFNMFIMKRGLADQYCTWLFSVLFELESRLDIHDYTDNDKRVFGFVGERLLDVWLLKNGISYKELPYIFLDRQNWIDNGLRFIGRKIKGAKLT